MCVIDPHLIARAVKIAEDFIYLWMTHRQFRCVAQQVLFGDIGNIFGLLILCQEMIEGLVFARAHLSRYRFPPFIGIGKGRVDIKYDAAKLENRCLTTSPIWYFAFLSIMPGSAIGV